MTEFRNDNADDDDLNFYDFLEIVSDKFDSITQQSREDSIEEYQNVLVGFS